MQATESRFELPTGEQEEGTARQTTTKTTLMLCNIPLHYCRDMIMDVLQSEGFVDHVTLIYVPQNLRTLSNFGYAFVDFDSVTVAEECKTRLNGFTTWNEPSERVLGIEWSDAQGLDANIERYRNSPIMHEIVQDESKPAMFKNGVRVTFPEPTKSIRAPRLRKLKERERSATADF